MDNFRVSDGPGLYIEPQTEHVKYLLEMSETPELSMDSSWNQTTLSCQLGLS